MIANRCLDQYQLLNQQKLILCERVSRLSSPLKKKKVDSVVYVIAQYA
jgi:hypothetical protein